MTKQKEKPKMKNLLKTGKRGIAAILTLCILLGIAGTCVYASSVMPEENEVVIEETIVADEETTQELMPMMARGGYGTVIYQGLLRYPMKNYASEGYLQYEILDNPLTNECFDLFRNIAYPEEGFTVANIANNCRI